MKNVMKSTVWGIWLKVELTLLGLFVILGLLVIFTQVIPARATPADLAAAMRRLRLRACRVHPLLQAAQLLVVVGDRVEGVADLDLEIPTETG